MQTERRCFKYLRVSLEDDAVGGSLRDESNSIANQRFMLNQYIQSHPDIGKNFEEIVDDGFSGTSFQRPGMSRLLALVEADQVDTVIVKDLSRFGRNYLEAGYLIELVFPSHHVRLIAVNDHYDTNSHEHYAGDIGLALNNIKNEFFSRDLSAKVKTTNDIQRRNGQFSGRVPYGYLTGPSGHDIMVDEEAAMIVRYIFSLAADQGMKTREIAKKLNAEGIVTPSLYKKQKRGYRGKVQSFWGAESVYCILINRIYTGSLEMYKGHLNSVGSRKATKIPRDEREIIPNTHQAIVSEETYWKAQRVIIRPSPDSVRKKKAAPPPEPMLARYLKCGCCGLRLFREHTTEPIYICHSARVRADGFCGEVACDAKALEPIVFQSITHLVQMADLKYEADKRAETQLEKEIRSVKSQLRVLSQKRKDIASEKIELYEQFRSGTLSLGAFSEQKKEAGARDAALLEQIETLSLQLSEMNREMEERQSEEASCNRLSIGDAKSLTPELLKAFVSKVTIGRDGSPEITFHVRDVFQDG